MCVCVSETKQSINACICTHVYPQANKTDATMHML